MRRTVRGGDAGFVARPRLTDRLDALLDPAAGTTVALVTAPPGFGKSTMVNSWADQTDRAAVAVLSLRGTGSGSRALWTGLLDAVIAAVRDRSGAAAAGGDREAAAQVADELARLAVPDREDQDAFQLELLDTLASAGPVALVLDDVQELRSPETVDQLDRFVARAEQIVPIVLLSRTRPPLRSLHDLRLRGRLDLIRATDLAFTREEVSACCPGLAEQRREEIWRRTDGWPAMVRLMEVAVAQGLDDGDPWHEEGLAAHLFAEVFSRTSGENQQLLLASAVADPVPLPLAVELSGRADAGTVLESAGQRSGLVTSQTAADETITFRMHPILRAYLVGELRRRDVHAERRLQALAGAWFADRGESLAALRHVLRAGDPELVERTFAECGLRVVHDGLAEPLLDVLAPRLRETGGPWVRTVAAAALADLGRDTEAEAALEPVAEHGDPAARVALEGVHALLRRRAGRQRRSEGAPVEAAEGVSVDVELAFALNRGAELVRAGDLPPAERLLRRAADLSRGHGRSAAEVDSRVFLAAVSSARADNGELADRVDQALRVAESTGWSGSARACLLHLLAGVVAFQDLDDHSARRHAATAVALLAPGEDPSTAAMVRALRAGSLEEAAQLDTRWLHESWQDDPQCRLAPDFVAYAAARDVRVSLRAGQADRLRTISDGLAERFGSSAETELAAAALLAARGQRGPALARLSPVLRGEVAPVYPLSLVEVHCFASGLAEAEQSHFQAVEQMRRAIDCAARLRAPRALLSAGSDGLRMLTLRQGSWGVHEDLVARLLGYVGTAVRPAQVSLTERERDVLRELPTLRTVEEIAEDMLVSINTLKTHMRSVYRKLGASSRREAVTEARRLGLL